MAPQFLPDSDVKFLAWLSQVGEPQKLSVKFLAPDLVSVRCGDRYQAKRLHETRDMIGPLKIRLSVNKTHYYASTMTTCTAKSSLAPIESLWAQRNPALFKAWGEIAFVYSAAAGHRHLAAQSLLTEKRLNRPISDLIGQPLRTTDDSIWLPRERAIESAIASPGESVEFFYDHVFQGVIWRFKGTALYMPDCDEVLCKIEDNPHDHRASWQRGYWMNLANP